MLWPELPVLQGNHREYYCPLSNCLPVLEAHQVLNSILPRTMPWSIPLSIRISSRNLMVRGPSDLTPRWLGELRLSKLDLKVLIELVKFNRELAKTEPMNAILGGKQHLTRGTVIYVRSHITDGWLRLQRKCDRVCNTRRTSRLQVTHFPKYLPFHLRM